MRKLTVIFFAAFCYSQLLHAKPINFVFISDLHYGITRPHFRGADSVESYKVNAALVETIKSLPGFVFPADGEPGSGEPILQIDAVVVTGDITNREELSIQPAATSWKQFKHDYIQTLSLPLLLVPGNHDASNAIGFTKPMLPLHDATSIASIYNLMKDENISSSNYDYQKNKVNFSRDMYGIHMMFVNIWPDSANRIWMEKDLAKVSSKTPVLIFTHDPPEGDPKHFTNPFGLHTINEKDKFENLLEENFKDSDQKSTDEEQKGFVAFLKKHSNIKAYFHGHSNYCEMYNYKGVGGEISLPTFRADSPMKGKYSKEDEHQLSLQVITFDPENGSLVSRELLWNMPDGQKKWGVHKKIKL